jgi:acyl-homoserine lactone acylase PvdQ
MFTFRTRGVLAGLVASISLAGACGDDLVASPPTTATGSTGAGGASPFRIAGLTAPVTAVTDPNGLLHLQCAADDDCFAALGYFHASNRFFFMDFVRNLVRGSLGGLVKAGDQVLQNDYVNRHFFTTREGVPLEEKLYADTSALVKGHLDAYAVGVNAWLADMREGKNGATLTTEYDFALVVKENIRDWEPEDCAAIGLYVLNDLSNNSESELALAQQYPAFDPALAADLFSTRPVFDAFTVPVANVGAGASSISDQARARVEPFAALLGEAAQHLGTVGAAPAQGAAERSDPTTGSSARIARPRGTRCSPTIRTSCSRTRASGSASSSTRRAPGRGSTTSLAAPSRACPP